jgi:hypothetical protein
VGDEPESATVKAINTAGHAVLFAGTTVVIALMGLVAMGQRLMTGVAVATERRPVRRLRSSNPPIRPRRRARVPGLPCPRGRPPGARQLSAGAAGWRELAPVGDLGHFCAMRSVC